MPSAKVIGVDLSPIQPVWLPPNVEFIVDDVEEEWADDSNYDFIHARVVLCSLRDPPKVIETAYSNLKPGGWIEFFEFTAQIGCDDGTLAPDNPLLKFYVVFRSVFQQLYGFDLTYVEKLPQQLEQTGFVNIQRKVYHLPIGDWPKDKHLRTIGVYLREVVDEMLSAVAAKPFVEAGMETAEIHDLLSAVRKVLANKRVHAYIGAHVVWAQKPSTSPT